MASKNSVCLLGLVLLASVATAGDVFAHLIIGTTAWMTQDDWSQQIAEASAVGISAFALNIAKDSYTDTQLGHAYDAAANTNFKMFISFDYDAAQSQGGFAASDVVTTINNYASRPAQYKFNNQPLVSTFEGPGNANDWAGIKQQTGCFFMPDYSSLGPQGAAAAPNIDGLLSWDAWPDGTADAPTSAGDYMSALGSRPFMMPVSPWFYTNLPSKNWLWRGDNLWHDSWQQAQQLNPALIEILTWNDWGESHYIGPNARDASAYPDGSAGYVEASNHSAWMTDLPYYIAAYKGGPGSVPSADAYTPHVTFYYRLSPGAACASTNTPCNAPYQSDHPANTDCDQDNIYFTAFSPDGTPSVTVEMGGASQTVTASGPGVFHSNVPFSAFNGQYGAVTVSGNSGGRDLGTATGDAIGADCGPAQWNAFVGTTA